MITIKNNKLIDYGHRGMTLEYDLNLTNDYYLEKDLALIYKKPTPIKVVKVEYPKNVIKEAYFNEPSTLDYNGIYKGKYLEFDAKETQSNTSFPISNIHKHQLEHMTRVIYFGGITFLIVRFTKINETYILLGRELFNFIESNDRKSIPIDYFRKNGFLVELKYIPRLDYISIIDKIMVKDVD